MTRLFASIVLVGVLAVGRIAAAAEATGWITYIDQQSDQIVLDDGRNFGVSEEINFSSLNNGVRVRISFEAVGDARIATEISLAPQGPQSEKTAPICSGDDKNHLTNYSPVPPNVYC